MSIPVFRPTIKRKEMDSVLSSIVSEKIAASSITQDFVSVVCQYLGLSGGVALASYRNAIRMAFITAGLSGGASVVLTPLLPKVYIEVCRDLGLQTVFADCDPDTGCISATGFSVVPENKPQALVAYYQLGYVPDFDALYQLGIPIIEDFSQAIGAQHHQQFCGHFGAIAVAELAPNNILAAGTGALVLSKDKKTAIQLKKAAEELWKDEVLDSLNASLALSQAKKLDKILSQRANLAKIFTDALFRSHHKTMLQKNESCNVFYSFPVLVKSGAKDIIKYSKKKNIEAVMAFEKCILDSDSALGASFPIAQGFYLRCVLFPLYPLLRKTEIELISKILTTLP